MPFKTIRYSFASCFRYPGHLVDLEAEFGWDITQMSRLFDSFTKRMYDKHNHRIPNYIAFWLLLFHWMNTALQHVGKHVMVSVKSRNTFLFDFSTILCVRCILSWTMTSWISFSLGILLLTDWDRRLRAHRNSRHGLHRWNTETLQSARYRRYLAGSIWRTPRGPWPRFPEHPAAEGDIMDIFKPVQDGDTMPMSYSGVVLISSRGGTDWSYPVVQCL